MAGNTEEIGMPVQILHLDFNTTTDGKRSSTLRLNLENLERILKRAGDKNVVLISIVGPSRQGKSFLLDFLLRYLESLKTDDTDWFGYETPSKSLDGFKWRSGIEPETSGMWMWSHPFVVKLGDGKECAILLMDTQGTYDEYTTQREWSNIVGLSLLTSSCLIFNFFNNLQEDTLSSLGAFVDYGLSLMAAGESTESTKSFQKLVFLIRDWNMPSDFAYGAKGGNAFLNRKLEIKPEQGEEAKHIRNTIRQCFEELTCFLMPDPGDKMKSRDYDGSIQGLNPKFSKHLEGFVTDLLSPEDLKVKLVGGNPVKASELQIFFEKYVEVFNSEDGLNPMSMLEATNQIKNTNIIKGAKETYRKNMQTSLRKQVFLSDNEIQKCHSKASEKAFQQFETAKKSGDQSIISEYKEILDEDIDREFGEFKVRNSEKKIKIIQESRSASLNYYRAAMNEELGDSFQAQAKLKLFSQSRMHEAEILFAEKCSSEDPDVLQVQISELRTAFDHEKHIVLQENEILMQKAENAMREIVELSVEKYTTLMKEETEASPYLSIELLEKNHKSAKNEAQEQFSKAKKAVGREFLRKFEDELEKGVESAFGAIRKENEDKRKLLELTTAQLVATKVKTYETNMAVIVENAKSEEDLMDDHDTCAKDIYTSFETNCDIPEEILRSQLPQLQELVQEKFLDIKRQYYQNSRNLEAECEKACSNALEFFNNEMVAYLGSKEYHRSEDFEDDYNNKLKQDAVDHGFNELDAIGVPDDEVEKHLVILKENLDNSYEKFKEQNTLKQALAAAKAQNDLHDKHREYEENMKKLMEKCRSESDLDALHRKTKDATTHSMESAYPNVHSSFLDPFIANLESEIESSFKEIAELFQLKKEESEAGTKSALSDARKFYKEEMEKHFKNQDFMSPNDLKKLHNKVTQITVDRCNKKIQSQSASGNGLSDIQKEDLSDAMEKVYLQYNEQNHMNMPADPAIGIDLGTTYCCVAVYCKGKVTIIENAGKKTTPSYVSFKDTCEVVGDAAKNQAHENPENTIYDAKRIIGRKFNDPKLQKDMKMWPFTVVEENGVPKIEVRGKTYHPEQISAKLLQEMKKAAEDYLGTTVKNAVITVPAYFNDGQRQATIDAGELAGLKVLNILNEPTAAAIAYRLQHVDLDARNVLIFDLGGGTFDVAVLRISDGKVDVKAVDGDTHLGGEDFDNNLLEHCSLEFQSQHGINLMDGKDSAVIQVKQAAWKILRRLKSQCEDRKIDLTPSRKVNVALDAIKDGLDLNVLVTREQFEGMNTALFASTIATVERVLDSAGVTKAEINDIVLVGGSTRIPKVQQLLSDFFNGKALNKTINPDEAVAYGAAIQAAILNGEIAKDSVDFTKIQDVTPMSLGIEVYGGGFSKIINKNMKVPVKLTETYKTAHNNQTSVQIIAFQGEDAVAINNDKLGEFVLNGVPPGLAGVENIEVEMEITEQGILHLTAVCTSTGGKKNLAITEYKQRLSRSAILKLLGSG